MSITYYSTFLDTSRMKQEKNNLKNDKNGVFWPFMVNLEALKTGKLVRKAFKMILYLEIKMV